MAFELDDEKALDILIWWIESTDGSIDYSEKQAVKKVLEEMNYSLETFYQKTVMHLGAMGTDELNDLIQRALNWAGENYTEVQKKRALALLKVIAKEGDDNEEQQVKLNKIEKAFSV